MPTSVPTQVSPEPAADAEARRVAAVKAYAVPNPSPETDPDPEFEALMRVAAQLFGMPIASVGLLDVDQVWLMAGLGAGATGVARELPLWRAVVARPDTPLVVSDLALDPRFAGSPLVQHERPARFFAGAAIVDDAGQALGAIAVLDHHARSFNTAQVALLQDLAKLALTLLQARQRDRQLRELAQTDTLTGTADAAQFEQALDVELRHAMRTGEHFAVLRLDLDGFADINTAYGQAAGDAVLREVGRRLRQQVRLGDLLARLGSDDFGIVMRHGADAEATMLAERIVAAVRQPIRLGDGAEQVSPGISIGVAAYSDQVASVVELLARAEASLQRARSQKESRWLVFGKLFGGADLRLVGNDNG